MDLMRKLRLLTNNLEVLDEITFYERGVSKDSFNQIDKIKNMSMPSDVWEELTRRFSDPIDCVFISDNKTVKKNNLYRNTRGTVILKDVIPFKDETRFGVALEVENCGRTCGAILFLRSLSSLGHTVGRVLWNEFAKPLQATHTHILNSDWTPSRFSDKTYETGSPVRLLNEMSMCSSIISNEGIMEIGGELMTTTSYFDDLPFVEYKKKKSIKRYKKISSILSKLVGVFVDEESWNNNGFGRIQVVEAKSKGEIIDECCVFGTTRVDKDCIAIYKCNWNGWFEDIRCYGYWDVSTQVDRVVNEYLNRAGHILFNNFGRIELTYDSTVRSHQTYVAKIYDNKGKLLKLM